MDNKIFSIIAVIIVLIGGYYLLKDGPQDSASATSAAPKNQPPRIINIEGADFKFIPDTITAQPGETIKINFTNTGEMPHDFVVRNLNINTKKIKSGETDSIVFTAPSAGDYTFFCSVGQHESMGMKGTLKVQ